MAWLFIIKICFTIKINSVCGVGRDTRNLCHKFNSQGSALRILGLRVARVLFSKVPCPIVPVPGSWVSWSYVSGSQSLMVPESRIPESQDNGSKGPRILGLRVTSPGSQGLGSPGLILDYAVFLLY